MQKWTGAVREFFLFLCNSKNCGGVETVLPEDKNQCEQVEAGRNPALNRFLRVFVFHISENTFITHILIRQEWLIPLV